MERRRFLSQVGLGVGVFFIGNVIESCKKDSLAPATVDFTLNLNDSANAALKSSGGSIVSNNVIVAHANTGEFLALSSICTHQGCTVGFNGTTFPCPCHGSVYAKDGSVLNGPAPSPLTHYNTSLSGSNLRIYS